MKKYFLPSFIMIILFSVTTGLSANEPEGVTIQKIGNEYIVNFILPAFEKKLITVDNNDFTQIIIPSYGVASDTGLPALPLVSFNLVIPYSEGSPGFQITNRVYEEEILKSKVFPFQAPWPKNQPIDKRPFTINKNFYQTSGKQYPFANISEPFVISGVKGVMVTIYPFNYNPLLNKLTYIKNGSFKIITKGTEENHSGKSAVMNNFLNDVFVNYNSAGSKAVMNYLIITAPEYQSSLTSFVNHKTTSGYNVSVVTTTTTGTTTTSIKSYIQTLYNNISTRPEFVLLVGDIDKIPTFTGSGEGTPNTDLNYALLDGTDYYADVFIGRFSISSTSELANVINKTIYMESYIGTLAKNNVFMSSTDNYSITEGTHNYVIDQYFNPAGYNNLKLYTYTYGATTAQLITALNANKLFAVYSGHGSQTSWADGPVLGQSDVRSLTNTVYPYVYSFACITGSYQISECFGETWIRTAHGGSGFYGSSVNSYWDEDDILERRLFKAMFEDDLTKITPMFNKAKIYLVNHYGTPVSSGTTLLRYLEMYNLMGDPSLATAKQLVPDSTAPTAITDLSAANPTSNKITLNWTAPYDSTFGGIYGYDIRYSLNPINNDNDFNAAAQIIFDRQNDTAGTAKTYTISGLNYGTTFHFAIKAYDLWGNKSVKSNPASGATFGAPQILVTPDSLHKYLPPTVTLTDTIVIHNVSSHSSTLDYSVELANNTFPGKISARIVSISKEGFSDNEEIKKDNPSELKGGSIKGHGGPDTFGYEWIDSDESNGPVYVWNDISTTGTLVSAWTPTGTYNAKDEGIAGPFSLGFNFKFYGNTKTQVYVSSNGMILFGTVAQNIFTNASIPGNAVPNEYIAPFWDDLDGTSQGTVHYKQDGNKFIIQFTNWQKYSATGLLTFQIVLYSNGKIMIYYNNMAATLTSATVGIENGTGTDGLQVAYNSVYVKNNLALQFAAEPEWLVGNSISGTLYNGNSVKVVLTFQSEDYPLGDYSMDMIVTSNDLVSPTLTVPIKMTIQQSVLLNISALIEGFYNGATMISDTISVELRNSSAPYNLVEAKKIVLNSTGTGSGTFTAPAKTSSYYLVIKHRNSIETWSAVPQTFSSNPFSYDFTNAQNKAYGNNLKQKDSKWCIFSGDVNQDEFIDGSDVAESFNASALGILGYSAADLNGDEFVDGSDVSIAYNNNKLGIGAICPSKKINSTGNINKVNPLDK